MEFDWWGATAQGSNPATAGSLARGAAKQANPRTSTNFVDANLIGWSRHALVPVRIRSVGPTAWGQAVSITVSTPRG